MQLNISEKSHFHKKSLFLGIAGLICLGGLIGAYVAWHYHKKAQLSSHLSEAYFLALDSHNSQKAFSELSDSKNKQIAAYAMIHASDAARQEHLEAQAKNFLNSENFQEEPLKGLATVMALNLRASQLEEASSEQDIRDLRNNYQKLAKTSPLWRDFAREGLVALDLRQGSSAGDKAEAIRLLKEILASPNVLSGMQQRASFVLQALES